jgi:hypothetical protein
MKVEKKIRNERERGNALFLILIAVALFAALSYAITQSGRGGGNVSNQTALITAGQVTEQPADVRAAVTRMIVTGISPASVTYTGAATVNDVFDQTGLGGGATNVPPPVAALATATDTDAWTYVPAGTTAAGIFSVGVGTSSTGGGLAIAVLQPAAGANHGVVLAVCNAINKGLGFPAAALAAPPVGLNGPVVWATPGVYAAAGSATTIHDATFLTGQDYACFQNTTGSLYTYYGTLIDQ